MKASIRNRFAEEGSTSISSDGFNSWLLRPSKWNVKMSFGPIVSEAKFFMTSIFQMMTTNGSKNFLSPEITGKHEKLICKNIFRGFSFCGQFCFSPFIFEHEVKQNYRNSSVQRRQASLSAPVVPFSPGIHSINDRNMDVMENIGSVILSRRWMPFSHEQCPIGNPMAWRTQAGC